MPIRLLLIPMLLTAAVAGCGPLPASAPPETTPARHAVTRRADEKRPAPTDAGTIDGATPPIRSAANLPAMADDYDAALAKAEAEGKPLLLFFTAPWCEYSRRLEAEVLTSVDAQAATARFVCVRVDVGRSDLRDQYRVKVFPTIIPATARGTASQRLTGAQTVESLVAGLTTALTAMTDQRPALEAAIQR